MNFIINNKNYKMFSTFLFKILMSYVCFKGLFMTFEMLVTIREKRNQSFESLSGYWAIAVISTFLSILIGYIVYQL